MPRTGDIGAYKHSRTKTAAKYDVKVSAQKQGETDAEYFKRLAKQADKRMRRLEDLAKQPGYENVLKWSYAVAQHELAGLGADRWERVPNRTATGAISQQNLQRRLNAVKRFLESPTSTKRGIGKVYQERANTLNERYGTEFTWEEMAKFFESGMFQALDMEYGSKTKMKALGVIMRMNLRTTQDVNKAIADAAKRDVKIADDEVIKEVKKMVRAGGKKTKALSNWLDANGENIPF